MARGTVHMVSSYNNSPPGQSLFPPSLCRKPTWGKTLNLEEDKAGKMDGALFLSHFFLESFFCGNRVS